MVIMSHKKTNSSVSVYLLYFTKFNLLQSIINDQFMIVLVSEQELETNDPH